MDAIKLTDEEIAWGKIYLWIHQRAEYLRAKEAATPQPALAPATRSRVKQTEAQQR